MSGRLLFLGTGGSLGIPMVACHCPVCSSKDTKNKRLRSSVLIQYNNSTFLIDSGPDFRTQGLTYDIRHLDGLIITHAHNDHTAGIDDLRPLLFKRPTPLAALMSEETYEEVTRRYDYFFGAKPQKLGVTVLPEKRGKIEFEGVPISYFSYEQGGMAVNGFRFGEVAYVSDIKEYPDTVYEDLFDVKLLVISALRHSYSPLHLTVDEAIAFAAECHAEMTYLTHISHELDHAPTEALLPPNVRLAYDGLELTFNN